jgi:alanyl-tRNA synthetase
LSTERIYQAEPHRTEFEARVVEARRDAVILDRTAFYPTGGGQPHDTGTLQDLRVVDVIEEEGRVVHLLEQAAPFAAGDTVRGRVDAGRRRDHLQQHSGQHLLSAAFVKVASAATLSFHLGSETSTLDLALAEDVERSVREAEELANQVIAEDRPMAARIVDEEEAARLPLRKEIPVQGRVRVVSIEDFDLSACGGTHALRTGEIGLVAILGHERYKKGTRLEFVAGDRARRVLHAMTEEADGVGALISAPRGERLATLEALLADRKEDRRRLRALAERAAGLEAQALAASEPEGRPIRRLFRDRTPDEVAALARALASAGRLALLAVPEGGAGKVVVAGTGDPDAGALLREVAGRFGGRGGGGPRFAQAGGLEAGRLEEVLAALEAELGRSG